MTVSLFQLYLVCYNNGFAVKNERICKNVRSTNETCIPIDRARLRDNAQSISMQVSFVLRTFLRIFSFFNVFINKGIHDKPENVRKNLPLLHIKNHSYILRFKVNPIDKSNAILPARSVWESGERERVPCDRILRLTR